MSISAEPSVTCSAIRRFKDLEYQPLAANLGELRARIDALDAQIVGLLAQRAACVVDATRFKRDAHQAAAPERQHTVFERVRTLARDAAGECRFEPFPDVVESAYRVLVAGFVAYEQGLLERTNLIEDSPQ